MNPYLPGGQLQTPVTSEALTSLRNRIEQDIHLLDSPGQLRFQKLTNTAEKAFAERALLFNKNRLLFKQNNESISRLSTRSTVVGKAKIMSYDNIVKTQRKRDVKEADVAGGIRRNSKRKSVTPALIPHKKSRTEVLEEAKREVEALGMGNYYSILQF